MADTGAPWNIPFVEPTDLVRDYPAADEAQALAVAAGLSAAGGLVAVKSVVKTDVFSASVAAGASVAVSGLSIEHAVAQVGNKVVLFGVTSSTNDIQVGAHALAADGVLLNIGDAAGARVRVASGTYSGTDNRGVHAPSHAVFEPANTSTVTYDVRVFNIRTATRTIFVNRSVGDNDNGDVTRTSSTLILCEVKV